MAVLPRLFAGLFPAPRGGNGSAGERDHCLDDRHTRTDHKEIQIDGR